MTNGTVTVQANGAFLYVPNINYITSAGQPADTFTYTATDLPTEPFQPATSNTATVTLTVTPRLSIPTGIVGTVGEAVVVPVNIDNPDPQGSGGLESAALAVDYDPAVFTVGLSDVSLGTVTSSGGWTIGSINLSPGLGQVGVTLSSSNPVTSTVGGSLVLLTFHMGSNTALGTSLINLAAANFFPGATVTTALGGPSSSVIPIQPTPETN